VKYFSKKRGFVAVDVPPLSIDLKTEVKARASFVRPENMHITLKFLGEYDIDEAKKIKVLEGFGSFELELEGLGAFPNVKNARVIWVGVKNPKKINELAKKTHELFGYNKFYPHITLVRMKEPFDASELLKKYHNICFGSLRVDLVKFKESILTPAGSIYKTLYEVKL